MTHAAPRYQAPPARPGHHPAVIVGGGLVGLTLALDLARHEIPVVLLDDDDTVSTGSRAICIAKRSLEIFSRLGLGRRMLDKGVTWNTGRVFFGDRQLFAFDLLPEPGHQYPAFVNLQQYYAEQWLVEACAATGRVNLRWRHRLANLHPTPGGAALDVDCPGGLYQLTADWLLACDGARSQVRRTLALPFQGRVFHDRFLIADIRMAGDLPAERRFWFDPPFHPNQSALLHKQPDGIWRIDLQLGPAPNPDPDPDRETRPDRVIPRVQAMLGPHARFELEWVSLYTFRCRRLERFVHDRIVFLGDAAHQVSPFGARGGNGGVQDADNLAWKLAAILQGSAPAALIQTYDDERIPAADENILHSTRATDFITPKSPAARAYRDAVLTLAADHGFARAMVNSGRLSRPHTAARSPLNAPESDAWPGSPPQGAPAADAPTDQGWLTDRIRGFTLLHVTDDPAAAPAVPGVTAITTSADSLAASRYGAPPGAAILFRPDQHVTALFRRPEPRRIQAAVDHALLRPPAGRNRTGPVAPPPTQHVA